MTEQDAAEAVRELSDSRFKYYRPLADAVPTLVAEAQDPKRIFTGIPEIDDRTRGIGRGHLCEIIGYSHSGKTLVLTHILRKNPKARWLYFAPDETRALVLVKLAAIELSTPAEQLEAKMAAGDPDVIRQVTRVAEELFPNVVLIDRSPLDADTLNGVYDEVVEKVWGGEPPDGVIIDFMDLFQYGDAEGGMLQKFNYIKGWGITKYVPLIVVHQTSRTSGKGGQEIGIDSGSHGGETHGTFLIGVWRERNGILNELKELRSKRSPSSADQERIEELLYDLTIAEHHLSVNLVKNKRPGGKTHEEPIYMEIEDGTGALVHMQGGDLPNQWKQESLRGTEEF